MPEELILPAEACAMLGVTDQTLRRWVESGDLPAIRTVGGHRRYRRSDVLALLAVTAEGTEA